MKMVVFTKEEEVIAAKLEAVLLKVMTQQIEERQAALAQNPDDAEAAAELTVLLRLRKRGWPDEF